MDLGPDLRCVMDAGGDWSTSISHVFRHGGWLHLLGTMWSMWMFGNNVEDAMGHGRFVVVYLLCGLAAAALQVVAAPAAGVPMVGASGALDGVMGAYVVLYPRINVPLLFWFGFYVTTFVIRALWMLDYWFLVQMIGGFSALGAQGGGWRAGPMWVASPPARYWFCCFVIVNYSRAILITAGITRRVLPIGACVDIVMAVWSVTNGAKSAIGIELPPGSHFVNWHPPPI